MMMVLIAVAAVAVASLPLLVGMAATALIPGIGSLRAEVTPWHVLHIFWMYPAIFAISTVTTGVVNAFSRTHLHSISKILEFVVMFLIITGMMMIFFEDVFGSFISAALTMVVFYPLVHILSRE